MSIRPSVIDRRGERPCLPANALLAVCERLAEGRHTFAPRARDRAKPTPQPHQPMTPHPPDQSLMAYFILCALALLCAWSVNTILQLLK
jgi:hypothetical protein